MNRFFTLSYVMLFVLWMATFTSCQQKRTSSIPVVVRDTTITPVNAYSDIFFDSLKLENIIAQESFPDTFSQRLRNFYNSRNYQYAWFTDTGFTEQTPAFWNLQSNYIAYSGDSSLYNPYLQRLFDSAQVRPDFAKRNDSTRLMAEIQLTAQFVEYASRAYQGNTQLNENDLGWFIPRKRVNTLALLDSLIKNKGQNVTAYEPVNRQYHLLKEHLLRHYALQQQGGWPPIAADRKKYAVGDTALAITAIKKRLHTTGDFTLTDTSHRFTDSLQGAVKKFQKRYGLKEDGVIGGTTLKFLNEPITTRIQQLLVNMERMRWVPAEPRGDFILVNIPQFRLTVYEEGKPAFGMNIVVGTDQHRTVVFTGNMQYVVFSPYWNVPPGILKNEILPAISRNPAYLAQHNMEWNGGSVRQKPGPGNALGKVKFMFPNSYNIYLHDTPSKNLFHESKRSFSHGCIRVAEPERLANWVLRNRPEWTPEKIKEAMNGSSEKYVTLKNPIPVYIGYFTAWVNEQGELNFREDIYGHDKRLAAHLFTR